MYVHFAPPGKHECLSAWYHFLIGRTKRGQRFIIQDKPQQVARRDEHEVQGIGHTQLTGGMDEPVPVQGRAVVFNNLPYVQKRPHGVIEAMADGGVDANVQHVILRGQNKGGGISHGQRFGALPEFFNVKSFAKLRIGNVKMEFDLVIADPPFALLVDELRESLYSVTAHSPEATLCIIFPIAKEERLFAAFKDLQLQRVSFPNLRWNNLKNVYNHLFGFYSNRDISIK